MADYIQSLRVLLPRISTNTYRKGHLTHLGNVLCSILAGYDTLTFSTSRSLCGCPEYYVKLGCHPSHPAVHPSKLHPPCTFTFELLLAFYFIVIVYDNDVGYEACLPFLLP